MQVQYVVDGQTETVKLRGRIDEGRWKIDEALPTDVLLGLLARSGPVHSYTLFTGYFPRRIRGEMQSYQVAFGPAPDAPASADGRPGPVEGLGARATSPSEVELSFLAAGSNHTSPPPARSYVVKQSLKPIGDAGDFKAAHSLCGGTCGFDPPRVGEPLALRVTDLRPNTTYYYAVAARNDAGQQGPRSQTARVTTK